MKIEIASYDNTGQSDGDLLKEGGEFIEEMVGVSLFLHEWGGR